jgi:hypothetical protein
MTQGQTPASKDDTATDGHTGRGHHLKEKAVHEGIRFLIMFLYLFVMFGLFRIHESIILAQHNIALTHYGFALVNALVLAKVMLVAEDLHLGRRFEDGPLIYPVLFKSLLFAILFIGFHVVEHVIIALWHGEGILQGVPEFGGGGITGVISVGVIMSVVLIPFFAFVEISRLFGAGALKTLIFKRSPKDFVIDVKLRGQ